MRDWLFERDTDDKRIDWCVFNDKNYTFVVMDKNKIVAGYSFIKRRINLFPYFAFVANNMFVIPSYQGFHLNVKLAKYAFQHFPVEEALLFGAPRKNVVPFHKRAGWKIEKPNLIFTCEINKLNLKSDLIQKI